MTVTNRGARPIHIHLRANSGSSRLSFGLAGDAERDQSGSDLIAHARGLI